MGRRGGGEPELRPDARRARRPSPRCAQHDVGRRARRAGHATDRCRRPSSDGVGAGRQVAVAAELGEEARARRRRPSAAGGCSMAREQRRAAGRRRPGTRRPARPGATWGTIDVGVEHLGDRGRRSRAARARRPRRRWRRSSAAFSSRVCDVAAQPGERAGRAAARPAAPAAAPSRSPPRAPAGSSASVAADQRVAGVAPLGHGGEHEAVRGRPTAGPWPSARRGRPGRRAPRPAPPSRTRPCRRSPRWARRGGGRRWSRRRPARRRRRVGARSSAATCSACQRARALPRVAARTATSRYPGGRCGCRAHRLRARTVSQGVGEALAPGGAGRVLEPRPSARAAAWRRCPG